MKFIKIIPISFLIISIWGCDYLSDLNGSGEEITQTREISPFSEIELNVSAELRLMPSTSNTCMLEGSSEQIEKLVFKQDGTLLTIESKGSAIEQKDQMLIITLPINNLTSLKTNVPSIIYSLDTIRVNSFNFTINSRGSFTNSNLILKGNNLTLSAYGTNVGNHKLSGLIETLNLTLEGISSVDASNLITHHVTMNQKSGKNSTVNTNESLNVNMYSSGNVYYYQHPEVTTQTISPGWKVNYGKVIEIK